MPVTLIRSKRELSRYERLALWVGQYEGSRIAKENSLICDRVLRAIDGLRTFRDLPKRSAHVVNYDRNFDAHHKLAGKIF